MLKSEDGQALPIVLLVLLLGAFVVVPALGFSNSALIGQRHAKNSLVDEYSADSAVTYVMWKLLDSVYASSPPASQAVTINGATVTVNITRVVAPITILRDMTIRTSSQSDRIDEDEEVWVMVSTPDTRHNGVYLAYDTVNTPSQVTIPWRDAGPITYYFHNNPTPPTGATTIPIIAPDIGYDALTMNTTPPTVTTLYNYDLNRDGLPGRWISIYTPDPEGNCRQQLTIPNGERHRILWRSPPLSADDRIDGRIVFRWWWGTEDGGFGVQDLTWWVCKFDPSRSITGSNPSAILSGSGRDRTNNLVIWQQPFDLTATVGGKTINARVDRISGSEVKLRSWQMIQ